MFFRRRRSLLVASAALLLLVTGLVWRSWREEYTETKQSYRVALLPIDNQTGDQRLSWADGAIREGAWLQLGTGAQASVFQARDAGDAAAQQATHLAYGRLELGRSRLDLPRSTPVIYSFSLEEVRRHSVVRRLQASGSVLKAASALASLVSAEAGWPAIRPAGVSNDGAFEFFEIKKYAECTAADPQAFWCWQRWAASTFKDGRKEDALSIIARGRQLGTRMPAIAQAQMDLLEASIRDDDPLRMAALEKLVQLDSTNPAAIAELASAFMSNRKFAQAESLYKTALKRNSNQPELWNLLGYAQAGQGHFAEARKSLEEYDRLAPKSPNPPDSRGEIEWMANNLDAASSMFLESYRRDASFNAGVALEKAALSHYLAGDVSGAESLANRYLTDRGKAGDVLEAYHRARWQFLWGNITEAQALLRLIVRRGGPDSALAASRLMLEALRENNLPDAKKWSRTVRELTPKSGNTLLVNLASSLAEGETNAVSDPGLHAQLAAIGLTLSGEFDSAVAAWDESLRSKRGTSDSIGRELKAWCLLRTGKTAESAALVRGGWPLLDSDDRMLFDFLVYPNLLFVRAEAAASRGAAGEARRLYDDYLRYAGPSRDRFGQVDKAKSASRL